MEEAILVDRVKALEDICKELQRQINNLDRNKVERMWYPYINPNQWPNQPFTYPYNTITCSTGEKV